MEHIRIVPDIDSDPDVEAAGWCAARVHELLLKVSGMKDLHGRIPPQYQDGRWLAKRWNLQPSDLPGVPPEDFIANGVSRLLKVGLLFEDAGAWVIRGWEKFYSKPKTGAERTAEYEERLRDKGRAYFIQCEVTKRIKIGSSANPGARLCELQTGSPTSLRLLGTTAGGLKTERALQRKFRHLSIGGEWFSEDPELLQHIAELTKTDATDEADKTDATLRNSTSRHVTSPNVVRAPPEKSFAPSVPEKPDKPDDAWDGMDFWAWAQAKRREEKLQPERRPNERAVAAWWSKALMQGATVKQLRRAFVAYGNDPFWTDRSRKPPVPWGGWVSQWERFVLPEEVASAG